MFRPYCFHYHLNEESFVLLCEKWDGSSDAPDALEVADLLDELRVVSDADFGIESTRGPILTVLLNANRAFVMWMSESGDEGMHAVDPDADGSDAYEFVLSNGQVDEFPLCDTVTREAALDGLAHFLETREPSPKLAWQVP